MIIERSIHINASPANVWRVFTDAAITRQMGGEYVTDWKTGSSFGWKGADGKMYTQGSVIQVESAKLLRHNLFDPADGHSIISVITYQLQDNKGSTTLIAQEELAHDLSENEYEDAVAGWNAALQAVKGLAEAIHTP